ARPGPDAVLPARYQAGGAVARRLAARFVLVPQHRPLADGGADSVAAGHLATEGGAGAWLLVRSLGRVHGSPADPHAGVDARAGRHLVRGGRGADIDLRGFAVAVEGPASADRSAGARAARAGGGRTQGARRGLIVHQGVPSGTS